MKYRVIGQNIWKSQYSYLYPRSQKQPGVKSKGQLGPSTMSQVTKLLLKSVMDRMKTKIEAERGDVQSGFRQGKETREGLLNLRLICERHLKRHSIELDTNNSCSA